VSHSCTFRVSDVVLELPPPCAVTAKAGKERLTPLPRRTAARLRRVAARAPRRAPPILSSLPATAAALSPRCGGPPPDEHTRAAATTCPALHTKTVSPHVLRHTTAVTSSQAASTGGHRLDLGHESIDTTQMYLDRISPRRNGPPLTRAGSAFYAARFRPRDACSRSSRGALIMLTNLPALRRKRDSGSHNPVLGIMPPHHRAVHEEGFQVDRDYDGASGS